MLQTDGSFGARVLFVRCAASPLLCLYGVYTTIHGTPRQKGYDRVFCERLPLTLSIGMRGPCFQMLNGWTLLGIDATCRQIPVPQAG